MPGFGCGVERSLCGGLLCRQVERRHDSRGMRMAFAVRAPPVSTAACSLIMDGPTAALDAGLPGLRYVAREGILSHVAEAAGLIEVRDLSKKFGEKIAVNGLSFTVEPGHVTGFLGPNGAGKSTTMRVIVGLDRPSGGSATIDGLTYAQLRRPLTVVGALLEARALHPRPSARNHPLYPAPAQGAPARRGGEVPEMVGTPARAGQ